MLASRSRLVNAKPTHRGVVSVALARPSRQSFMPVRAMAAARLPTVSETKQKFFDAYTKPVSSMYSTVIIELLVQQHFVRYNKNYMYNMVFALGFVSVFDQILDTLTEQERKDIFAAYINSLGESPEQYRKDAAAMEQLASSMSGPEALTPDASGNELQKALAQIADASAAGTLAYNKFFAIGLFRLLELTGAKEPAALERLVKSLNVKPEAVNRDLLMYKGILSKLSAAKEMMKEFLERERRKQGEREEEKRKKAEAAAAAESSAAVQA